MNRTINRFMMDVENYFYFFSEGTGGDWRGLEGTGGDWRGLEGTGGDWRIFFNLGMENAS
jgi:hypothetical protein